MTPEQVERLLTILQNIQNILGRIITVEDHLIEESYGIKDIVNAIARRDAE